MNRNRKKTLFLLCFLVFLCVESRAQEVNPAETASHYNWYIGLQGGLPFGISTFNSFGADKTRIGWSTGLYGGYRFNNIFSLDASASFGKTGMSARDCCTDYWLGNDGERYFVPVAGMEGWNYSNLYSRVNLQRYGLHLNVNLLGFFPSTTQNRWSVNLSPAIYGIGSKASIKTISGDKEVLKGNNTWRLGQGGDFSVGYRMTENLSVNLYSGITHLTGKQMDAVSEYHRKSNFVWESGLKLGWTKMKKYTIKSILILAIGCMLHSCLDLDPKDQIADGNYWQTATDFKLFSNQFYGWTRDFKNSVYDAPHSDKRSDLIMDKGSKNVLFLDVLSV